MRDVVIVGAGQAGLATAYWLQQLAPGLSVLVLESGARPGQSWLERWNSLRLFTPRRFSQLGGRPFPAGATTCPSREEMADYLAGYASHVGIEVACGTTVEQLSATPDGFLVAAGERSFRARQVVIATGPFREPVTPAAADALDRDIVQLHSSAYRQPTDFPPGEVAVVGGGDSAAQLAVELSASHRVTLITPSPPWSLPDHLLGLSTYTWLGAAGILRASPEGLLARRLRLRPDPIFGRELPAAIRRGRVTLIPHRVVGGDGGQLHLANETQLTVRAVLWCTGFRPDYSWLQVPGALDADGLPRHDRGAAPIAGLHWMGLPWQARLDSSIVHGANADARRTAKRIRLATGSSR